MENEEKKVGFKVMDRRRFDAEGNSRPGGEPSPGHTQPVAQPSSSHQGPQPVEPSKSQPSESQVSATRVSGEPAREAASRREAASQTGAEDAVTENDGAENPRDFLAFVSSLGTQAAAALSGIDVRSGMTVPPDPVMARHYIEILEMLREKTKGNLSPEETTVFDQVLHQLRLAFVRAARGAPLT